MPLVEDLIALADDAQKQAVAREHPLYAEFKVRWDILANAYDGTGGFQSGHYLAEFPREDKAKYDQRRSQARYHNYVESLVELFTRYLTRNVDRGTTSEELEAWWRNVDGRGTSIDGVVRDVIAQALASGHVGVLVDKPMVEVGETRAQDTRPFATLYAPLTIQDWIWDRRDGLRAVKLIESVTPDTFDPSGEPTHQLMVWDHEMWARFDDEGLWIPGEAGAHGLGRVPLEVFRPKRMKRFPFLGKPLVNSQVIVALFNRASEEDEVLRTQAFSQLVVSLPQDAEAEQIRKTQDLIAEGGGTQKALVVPGSASFETPDLSTAQAIRDNQSFLVREIYRMAHVPFRQDTREVESADAVRLQHQELNEMLRGMANDLVDLEHNLARLFFGWQSPTLEQAERNLESAAVSVQYPDEFFTRELASELEGWAAAVAFGLGPTAEKAIKRRVVSATLADESDEVREAIEQEIEAGASAQPSSPAEQLRQAAQERLSAFVEEDAA